jgi:alanine-glyoxylate transaminase / serine-glyoxylate transaminase / serine-pyruvate transaminase
MSTQEAPPLLMGAGPSTVPPSVLDALGAPTIGHLDPRFLEIADRTNQLLRSVFRTANQATFAVSGTGSAGMEAMLVNFVEPDDHVVVAVCGAFGERIVQAAQRLGARVTRVDGEPGRPVDLQLLRRAIGPDVAALAVVHGETSTGVAQPLDDLGTHVHARGGLLLVDCVTSLGGYPLDVDALEIDVAFSGTQKCLNCPPGLAPMTISDRALDRMSRRRTPVPSWCFDVAAILGYWDASRRSYHHTPPVNTIYALQESLRLVCDEGLAARWRRHAAASAALLAGLDHLGLEPLVAAEDRLWPLTTVRTPRGIDEAAIRRTLLDEHGIEISAGLGDLKGEIWRIGTMGVNASLESVDAVLAALASELDAGFVSTVRSRAAQAWHAQ